MAKFQEKSIILYGVSQIAEGVSAIRGSVKSGTISITLAGTTVTGVGSSFDTEVTANDIIYNAAGVEIAKVISVDSATSLTTDPANVAVTAEAFSIDSNVFSGTVTTSLAANTVIGVGTSFLTELTPDAYLYDVTGTLVGQVDQVTDDTNATMYANGAVAITAASCSTGLGARNALAALNLNYFTELTSEAFVYVGDALDRDERTVITDKFAKFDFETFIPSRGAIAGSDPVAKEVPLADWFGSAGLAAILSADTSGSITFTNSIASNELLTVEVRLSSPDIITDKTYTMTDCRGMVDLDNVVGSLGKVKFDYQGNLVNVTQKTPLVADFGLQKANTAPTLKSNLVSLSRLLLYSAGVEPADAGVTNFCFDKITAPNFAGFGYDRYQTSCEEGWSKEAIPSDVNLTIVADEAGAVYNPDNQLEENHTLAVRWGSGTGSNMEIFYHKLQLANVGDSAVAKYKGQDLSFRNVGTVDLVLK